MCTVQPWCQYEYAMGVEEGRAPVRVLGLLQLGPTSRANS